MTQASERSRTAARDAAQPYLNTWGPFSITRDAITPELTWRYCEVAEDPNPVYWDEEFAKQTRFGRLVFPPQGIFAFTFQPWWSPDYVQQRIQEENKRLSDGVAPGNQIFAILEELGYVVNTVTSTESEYVAPFGPGDGRIKSRGMTVDVSEEHQTRPGKGVFVTSVTEYRTEVGDRLVARSRLVLLRYDPTTPRQS